MAIIRCRGTYLLPRVKMVISEWQNACMRTQYSDDVVDVVPNSVDRTQFFAPIRGKQPIPTVGFLYSQVQFKGVGVTLKALGALRYRASKLRLLSFGSHKPTSELA